MSGMISVRVTSAERKKLMELKAQRGCQTMSQVIRLMLGFPRSVEHESIEGADDIDGVGTMIRVSLRLVDRVETMSWTLAEIARKQGIKQANRQPIERLERPIDPEELPAFQNGHRHPALPEGFRRG